MPNWKKLIVSGSDANLNSLNVTTSITGSDVKIDDWGSISGSLANLTDNTPDGSGTANYITKWSDSDTLTSSTVYDNGGIITIGSTQQGWSGNKLNIGSTSEGASGMNILTSATGNAYIIFSDVVDGSSSEYANQIRYSHTDNFLAIQTQGTERLRIKSGGNIGISENDPDSKLQIGLGTGTGSDGIFIKGAFAGGTSIATSKNPFISLGTSTSAGYTSTIYLGANATATAQDSKIEWSKTNNALSIYHKGTGTYREHVRYGDPGNSTPMTKMFGNIGIGNHFYANNPTSVLDINDSGGVKITSTQGLALSIKGGANSNNIFEAKNSSNNIDFVVKSTGNVGIGTASPGAKLHVYNAGTSFIKIDSDSTAPYMAGVEFLRSSINGGRIYNDGGAVQVKLESYFGYDATNPTRGGFTFKTAPVTSGTLVDALRINALGDVGIGTSSPGYKLDIDLDNVNDRINITAGGTQKAIINGYGNIIAYGSLTSYSNTLGGGGGIFNYKGGTATQLIGHRFQHVNGSFTATSGDQTMMQINPNINQTSTAGYTGIKLDVTETATGSGDKNLLDLQVDGVSKYKVNSDGDIVTSGDLTVAGTVTAQEFHTEFVSASILYESGSTKFGDTVNDNHDFTGSLNVLAQSGASGIQLDRSSNTYININNSSTRNEFNFKSSAGLRFYHGTDSTTPLFISSSGNVGIGTTSPSAMLDIRGGSTGNNDVDRYVRFKASNGEKRFDFYIGGTGNGSRLSMFDHDGTTEGVRLQAAANGNNHILGNVGIGTTTPNSKLDIRRSGNGVALELIQTSGNVNDFIDLKMIAGNTTAGTLGTILRHKRDGSGGGDFIILTNPTLTGTPTEKMRITSAGAIKLNSYGSGNFTGTVASTLGVDSSGNIIEFTGGGGGSVSAITSGADTRVAYFNGTDSLEGSANFTWDDSTLDVNGTAIFGTSPTNNAVKISVNQASTFPGSNTSTSRFIDFIGGNSGANTEIGGIRWLNTDGDSGNYQYHAAGITSHNGGSSNDGDLRFFVSSDASADSSTGVIEAVRINTTGHVGIGTTSPSEKLHVVGYAKTSIGLKAGNYTILNESGNETSLSNTAYYPMFFKTNNSTRMTISNAGNVGIGTTTPTGVLEIAGNTDTSDNFLIIRDKDSTPGSARPSIRLAKSDGTVLGQLLALDGTNQRLQFSGNNTQDPHLTVYNNGNVGIGNTSPSQKLEVTGGNVKADEYLYNATDRTSSKNWKFLAAVNAGTYRELGSWRATEGNVVLRITVQSKTSANSGTAVYMFQGGFNQAADGWYELVPAFKGGGHGNAQDGWKVLWYESTSYTFKIAVAVPTGLNNKNLNVSVEFLGDTEGDSYYQYNALTTTGTIPTYSLERTTSYSNRNLVSSDSITAQYNATNYTVLGYDYLDTYGGSQLFKVAGTERLRITSTGNVGIGTSTPQRTLDVNGEIQNNGIFRKGGNVIIKSTGSETMFGPGGSGIITFHNSATMTTGDETMRIDANGNLLLNNTSAGARLDIREDTNYAIRAEDATGHYFRVNTGGDVDMRGDLVVQGTITAQQFHSEFVSASIIYESGSTKFGDTSDDIHSFSGSLRVTGSGAHYFTDGNVGIGNSSPQERLDITGNIVIRSTDAVRGIRRFDDAWSLKLLGGTSTTDGGYVEVSGDLRGSLGNAVAGEVLLSQGGNSYATRAAVSSSMLFKTHYTGGSATDMAIVGSTGNVGIGTTSPTYKLDVESSGNVLANFESTTNKGAIRISDDDTVGYISAENGRIGFGTSPILSTSNITMLTSNKNVGIGTTSPAQKLHINGNFLLENNNEIRQKDSGGTQRTIIELDSSNDLNIGGSYSGALKFMGGGSYTEQMRIHDDGNVGIGTTNPGQKLQVAGRVRATTDPTFEVYNSSANRGGIQWSTGVSGTNIFAGGNGTANAVMTFQTNTSERMRITSGGNVGIGTTSPSRKLDVEGRIRFSSNSNQAVNGYGEIYTSYSYGKGQIFIAPEAVTSPTNFHPNGGVTIGPANTSPPANGLIVSGNVGIGTTAPKQLFHVHGGSTAGSVTKAVIGGTGGNGESYLYLAEHFSGNNVNYGFSFVADGNSSNNLLIKRHSNSTSGITVLTIKRDTSDASFSGALQVGSNLDVNGTSLTLSSAAITYQNNNDVDTGTETIATVVKANHDAAFFDYVVKSGTNLRAGTVMAVHDGTNVEFTDNSTKDIGDTSGVTFLVDISGTDLRLRATTTSDNWIIKTLVKSI